ncbi:hypothetical protein [Burkholderia dolosa]|uniref:hypothetical protein n=1 Tax=Burkholderia dolosa TaxID=152500 RepID=UPI0027D26640|nr:hypothetical protein [Burkholderia dolosa]
MQSYRSKSALRSLLALMQSADRSKRSAPAPARSHAKPPTRAQFIGRPRVCNAAETLPRDAARSIAKDVVLAMIADRAARRVRESVAGLPRCVIADAKRQVPEFKRPS